MGRNAPARLVVGQVMMVRASSAPGTTSDRIPRPLRTQTGDPALRPRTTQSRGFAADPRRASEAGRRGGKRGQAKGTAHRWTTEEARRAGGLRGDPGMGKGQRRKRG